MLYFASDSCKPKWVELMEACWHEDLEERTSFSKIQNIIREINGGKAISLVDNMIRRLESHTKNLEDIVHDRYRGVKCCMNCMVF